MPWILQTILFPSSSSSPKGGWTLTSSRRYLIDNGYKYNDIDVKGNHIRYRQKKPPSGGAYYKTITRFSNDKKIELVYYFSPIPYPLT